VKNVYAPFLILALFMSLIIPTHIVAEEKKTQCIQMIPLVQGLREQNVKHKIFSGSDATLFLKIVEPKAPNAVKIRIDHDAHMILVFKYRPGMMAIIQYDTAQCLTMDFGMPSHVYNIVMLEMKHAKGQGA